MAPSSGTPLPLLLEEPERVNGASLKPQTGEAVGGNAGRMEQWGLPLSLVLTKPTSGHGVLPLKKENTQCCTLSWCQSVLRWVMGQSLRAPRAWGVGWNRELNCQLLSLLLQESLDSAGSSTTNTPAANKSGPLI